MWRECGRYFSRVSSQRAADCRRVAGKLGGRLRRKSVEKIGGLLDGRKGGERVRDKVMGGGKKDMRKSRESTWLGSFRRCVAGNKRAFD